MAPVGYGMLAAVAGTIVFAAFVGAIGGVIIGRLKADLTLGVVSTMGVYLLVSMLDHLSPLALLGMLPLILTFLVGSLTTQYLEDHVGLRPLLATSAALGSAFIVGYLYALPMKFGLWGLADVQTVWIAAAILSFIIIVSIRKRMPTTR
ncbi:MAG TPA: hypothetical protein VLA67_03955 [Nitrospiraceae bacterium]|nr:hypothetical protein [Nitrospiraceae bacterium]